MQDRVYNSDTRPYPAAMPAGRPAQHPRSAFGERLTTVREHAGLTQVQFAEKLGVTQRVIAHWERSSVTLRTDQLSAIADALGVTTDFLLGRHEGKPLALKGPTGKVRQIFERVSQLPRQQQNKVVEFVEAFVNQYISAG